MPYASLRPVTGLVHAFYTRGAVALINFNVTRQVAALVYVIPELVYLLVLVIHQYWRARTLPTISHHKTENGLLLDKNIEK